MEENEKKVSIVPNGPYEIKGNVPLNLLRFVADTEDDGAVSSYQFVKKYPIQEDVYFLCRCGQSQNKPFCDGAHYGGFDGTETAGYKTYDEMAQLIEGKVIDMLDAEELCAVARLCDTHGTSWNLVEEGNTDDVKNIVTYQCNNCPSGRLTAVTKEGKRIEPELPQEISVLEDGPEAVHGPLWIKGGIPIESGDGKAYPVRNRVTLCRCGKSQNKPFCDARHIENSGELNKEE